MDFRLDRVWMHRRSVTTSAADGAREKTTRFRHLRGPSIRAFDRLFVRFLDRQSRRYREHYYDGMTHYKMKRDGRWSSGWPLRPDDDEATYSREHEHPLWLLSVLPTLSDEADEATDGEVVRGVATTRYAVRLSATDMTPEAWRGLAQPNAREPPTRPKWWRPGPFPRARTEVPAAVWLDDDGRIRRMSFEVISYHPWIVDGRKETPPARWSTTEFWDFGVRIDRQPPPPATTTPPPRQPS